MVVTKKKKKRETCLIVEFLVFCFLFAFSMLFPDLDGDDDEDDDDDAAGHVPSDEEDADLSTAAKKTKGDTHRCDLVWDIP